MTHIRTLDDVVVTFPEDGERTHGAKPGAHTHGPREATDGVPAAPTVEADLPLKGKPLIEVLPLDDDEEALKGLGDHRLEENGNRSRASRQEARPSRQVEDPHTKAVRDPRPGKLIVPEEKRCEALTTRSPVQSTEAPRPTCVHVPRSPVFDR